MIRLNDLLCIHRYCEFSRVNGYGVRAVIWTQGCSLRCEGCFNTETHSFLNSGINVDPLVLGEKLGENLIDGLTITGGEPLDQPYGIIKLINSFKNYNKGTVFLFTGYDINTILNSDIKRKVILLCDVVIAGPYIDTLVKGGRWSGKNIIIINKKLSLDDVIPKYDIEVTTNNNDIIITGYPNSKDIDRFKQLFINSKR